MQRMGVGIEGAATPTRGARGFIERYATLGPGLEMRLRASTTAASPRPAATIVVRYNDNVPAQAG